MNRFKPMICDSMVKIDQKCLGHALFSFGFSFGFPFI
jgi:hypothetical protein